MPNTPGISFGTTVVTGIVGTNRWAPWLADNQEAHAVGVEGVSSIQGELISQDFDVPIIIAGYNSQIQRDNYVRTLEKLASRVRSLEIRVAGGVVIFTQAANVKFLGVAKGNNGVDAIHGYWRELMFTFRLLATS
jgi:hypothetical protein